MPEDLQPYVMGLFAKADGRPVAEIGEKIYTLEFATKARILYFLMGTAAALFISADVIAEFDKDPNTRTATSFVKEGIRRWKWPVTAGVLLFTGWLTAHFLVERFPL